jgi:hypothetical protein
MSYTVKSVGAASFKTIDLQCPKCQYEEERSIDLRGCDTDEEREQRMSAELKCPNCEEAEMERVWRHAPSVGTKSGSDEYVAKMKKSFKERFIKKELDQVRHKHGRLYDDAVRSAAATRIKKGEA